MARDYQSMLGSTKGVWVPRWLVIAIGVLFFGTLTLRILRPPAWPLQRLDSPNGELSAQLSQHKYLDYSYKVKVKHGAIWKTVFQGAEFKPDFKVNYRPTLYWDEESAYLLFSLQGKAAMVYEVEGQRTLDPRSAGKVITEHFAAQFD